MNTKYDEPPPNYSSVVFGFGTHAPPADYGSIRIGTTIKFPKRQEMPPSYSSVALALEERTPPAPPGSHANMSTFTDLFFELSMLPVPSAVNITHEESQSSNDSDYLIRDANGSSLFSGKVENTRHGQKVIHFKNRDKRTVFVVKMTIAKDFHLLDIYTQNGTTRVGSMALDFKRDEQPTLTINTPGIDPKMYHSVLAPYEELNLKDSSGRTKANAHFQSTSPPIQICLDMIGPHLNGFEKAALLGWTLFWAILAGQGDKSHFYHMCGMVVAIILTVVCFVNIGYFDNKDSGA